MDSSSTGTATFTPFDAPLVWRAAEGSVGAIEALAAARDAVGLSDSGLGVEDAGVGALEDADLAVGPVGGAALDSRSCDDVANCADERLGELVELGLD